jgi:four helix bundle protein
MKFCALRENIRMASTYGYRNLILWQKAQNLGYEVIQLTRHLPQSWANAIIARQVIASATSIAANIAEGHGRFSVGAHRHHLSIARGSAAETDSWINLLHRDGAIDLAEEQRIHRLCQERMVMLASKMRDLDQHSGDEKGKTRELQEQYVIDNIDQMPPFPFTPDDCS